MYTNRTRQTAWSLALGTTGALLLGSTSTVAHAAAAEPLQVSTHGNAASVAPGGSVVYAVNVTNTGDIDETVAASLNLGEGLRFAAAGDGGSAAPSAHAGWTDVTWSGLTVPAGETRTVTVTANVADSARIKVTVIGRAQGAAGAAGTACTVDPQCDVALTVVDPPADTTQVAATSTTTKSATKASKVKADQTKKKAKKKNKKSRKAKARKSRR